MEIFEYSFSRKRIAESPATVRAPRDIALTIGATIADEESEHLVVIALDAKNKVIGYETVYKGNVSAAVVRVGELFRFAVRLNAVGIIIMHNHPSGDPAPSPDDLHLTAEAIAAGKILDIDVLDHVVVAAEGSWTSLRDRGVNFSAR